MPTLDWIDSFMDFTDGVPTPEIFRKWTAITVVAGALERRIWVETGMRPLYPNLFTLLVAPPGIGKCLSPTQRVITFEGELIAAGSVKNGMRLIGPDGKPRTVSGTTIGRGPMFRILPVKGQPFECNGDHILSLKKSRNPGSGQVKFVSVNEWLSWNNWQKSEWKLWRTGVEEFGSTKSQPVDPYFVGLFLGDGDSLTSGKGVHVTTADPEILAYLKDFAEGWNLKVTYHSQHHYALVGKTWRSNALTPALKALGINTNCANKFVPQCIKTGTKRTRLKVLAGLLDSDGSYNINARCYDFTSKSRALAEDVAFLARSLGMAAYVSACRKGYGSTFRADYWRVILSGNIALPSLLPRKQSIPRAQIKNPLVTGFRIEALGEGDYAGFAVDSDHQFLLEDFTVTHNSNIIDYAIELWFGVKDLKVAPNNMTKASLIDSLAKADRKVVDENGVLHEFHSMVIPSSEFGVLIPAHDLEFLNVLNLIWDNPRMYTETRRTLSKDIEIVAPQMTILAGSQPGFLATLLPEEAWVMGFTSRLIMIYSAVTPEIDIFHQPPNRAQEQKALTDRLKYFCSLLGCCGFTAEARSLIVAWQKTRCEPVPQHSKLQNYLPRRMLHVLKLSMVSCVSRTGALMIEGVDVDRAMGWLFEAERLMPDIFRDMVGKSDSQVIQELWFYLWQIWIKDKQPIHESRLFHFLQARVPSDKVLKVIETAERSHVIQLHAGTSTYSPRPKQDFGVE